MTETAMMERAAQTPRPHPHQVNRRQGHLSEHQVKPRNRGERARTTQNAQRAKFVSKTSRTL